MNGSRLLLDTNAVVALLRGHPEVVSLMQSAAWVAISIISAIEFLCFSALPDDDRQLFASKPRATDV